MRLTAFVCVLLLSLSACVTVERDLVPDQAARGQGFSPTIATTGTPRDMVNTVRAEMGLSPLRRSSHLDAAAAAHANDMVTRDFYSHVSSNGNTVRDRVEATGYGSCLRAENIAWGQDNEQIVTNGWIHSPSHRVNILNRKATHVGFAGRRNPGGKYDPVWVMVIAARDC